MRKTILAIIIILMFFGVAYTHYLYDGQRHVCNTNSEVVILYDLEKSQWNWYVDSGVYNPSSGLPIGPILPILKCPFCGCKPDRTYCDD